MPEGLEGHDTRGIFDIEWTTKVAAGPYISEFEDAGGTYYRAPPGGLYFAMTNNSPVDPTTYDGGIWVPRDHATPPVFYTYYSTANAVVAPLPTGASCANAVLVPSPQGTGADTVAFATGGAIGGAAGGAIGRGIAHSASMSYGQAAGAGAAGGAIGGLIVAALINMDVGKIFYRPMPNDPAFIQKLTQLTKEAKPIPSAQGN
ncbi:hypothetical protein [Bordetella genomosp. 11]|nr:hypothetical protein [Bordetella genomosp. 11]